MWKFGYILTNNKETIAVFSTENTLCREIEFIFDIELSRHDNSNYYSIQITPLSIEKVSNRIKYYLSIRNNEKPDYDIDWKGRFDKNKMFVEEIVLGNKMELFMGNADLIIDSLSKIHNHITPNTKPIYLYLAKNHRELEGFLKKDKSV